MTVPSRNFTARPGPFAAMSLAGAAADGAAALVTRVGKAKLNVKKYPDSSRRFSVIDLLRTRCAADRACRSSHEPAADWAHSANMPAQLSDTEHATHGAP